MKKIAFILALQLTMTAMSWAQTDKGRWQVGAQFGNFKYQDNGKFAQKDFAGSINPTVGYFLANNLLVGMGIPLSYTTSALAHAHFKARSTGIGLSPFIRYYSGKSKLKPYAGLAYEYNQTRHYYTSLTTGESRVKGYSSILSPTIGLAYFLSSNVALHAGLNYTIEHKEVGYIKTVPVVEQGISDNKYLSLEIGLQLYFGK